MVEWCADNQGASYSWAQSMGELCRGPEIILQLGKVPGRGLSFQNSPRMAPGPVVATLGGKFSGPKDDVGVA